MCNYLDPAIGLFLHIKHTRRPGREGSGYLAGILGSKSGAYQHNNRRIKNFALWKLALKYDRDLYLL